jgi:hypothetical protein
MNDVRNLVTLTIFIGFGLAVLSRPDAAVRVITSVSNAWFGLIGAVKTVPG